MSGTLSDEEVALLCDIGEFDVDKATESQKQGLSRLLAAGYIERADDKPASPYRPTRKGMEYIAARGAGLNES